MTLADRLVPYYFWFDYGFGRTSVVMGLFSFGMSLVTMITVKGIYVPLWAIGFVAGALILFCTGVGYFFERYKIMNRITSHSNRNTNPEIDGICKDIELIKAKLGIEEQK
jgi:hypothetical protein